MSYQIEKTVKPAHCGTCGLLVWSDIGIVRNDLLNGAYVSGV